VVLDDEDDEELPVPLVKDKLDDGEMDLASGKAGADCFCFFFGGSPTNNKWLLT